MDTNQIEKVSEINLAISAGKRLMKLRDVCAYIAGKEYMY